MGPAASRSRHDAEHLAGREVPVSTLSVAISSPPRRPARGGVSARQNRLQACCWGLLGIFVAQGAVRGAADDYWSRRDALDAAYSARLAGLADCCRELKLDQAAQTTRAAALPRDPRRQYIFLPGESDPAQPPPDAPQIVQQWYARFSQERRAHADALLQLARDELQADRPARAYQLLHEVLYVLPDHDEVRGLLGYRQVSGRWRKPESVIRARRSPIAIPHLGFSAGKHWVVESEHFRITTDHSEAAGTELAAKLEVLHDVWQQLFFAHWSSAAVLARRFAGNVPADRSSSRHRVVLFRDRQTYVERLQRLEPQIALSQGLYWEPQKTAYFYLDQPPRDDLYYHEVTHQLFAENGRAVANVAERANAWIVEGVAMYLESLRCREGYCTVGGVDANRLQYARYRTLNQGFFVPLEQLTALGRRELQQHEDVRRLYSLAAGLAALLMDDHRGRYRPLLADYLAAVYQGRDQPQTLASLADFPLADLERQYREFLDVSDQDLAFLPLTPETQSLSLGRTSVTDAGLQHVAALKHLEWLDVAYTAVGDAGLGVVQSAAKLNHLIAEHTRITDAVLETIAECRQLEILDLTGTRITDAGLAHVRGLTKLRELWIGQTAVSDAGLEYLAGLVQLETLDVDGTQVTRAGFERLKQSLPRLQTEAASP